MGLDLVWQDENGNPIDGVADPQSRLQRILRAQNLDRTMCLRFIDPFGDATFNQLQLPTLIHELEALRPVVTDPQAAAHLDAIIGLTIKARASIHTYLKFIGD